MMNDGREEEEMGGRREKNLNSIAFNKYNASKKKGGTE